MEVMHRLRITAAAQWDQCRRQIPEPNR